jgi:hypothetical protein
VTLRAVTVLQDFRASPHAAVFDAATRQSRLVAGTVVSSPNDHRTLW